VADQLTDETWRALDPYAGRLSTREARGLLMIVLAMVGLVLAGYAVNLSGVVAPRLITFWPETAWGEPGSDRADPSAWEIHYKTTLLSSSWYPVRVQDVQNATPGLELVEISGLPGEPLGYREQREVHLVFRVTDCEAMPAGRWPVELRVTRAWGQQAVTLHLGRDEADGVNNTNQRLRNLVCGQG
jgi:hypothetical protein